jgi:hypothetical protein
MYSQGQRKSRVIPLLPLSAFMACYSVNLTVLGFMCITLSKNVIHNVPPNSFHILPIYNSVILMRHHRTHTADKTELNIGMKTMLPYEQHHLRRGCLHPRQQVGHSIYHTCRHYTAHLTATKDPKTSSL